MRYMRSWFVCFLMTLSIGAFADRARVAGTSVSLEPPAGFTKAKQFPGFQDEKINASIMVSELPVAFEKMKEGMTQENLKTKGMDFVSQQENHENKSPFLLIEVIQKAGDIKYRKWILVTGNTTKTVMAVGTAPLVTPPEVGEAIKKSLLTTRLENAASQSVWEGLSFRITPSKKMKIAGKYTNALALTRTGRFGSIPPQEPLYIVAPIIGTEIIDAKSFAYARIQKTDKIKNIRNIKSKSVTVNGYKGYELLAEANDETTGIPIKLYQIVLKRAGQSVLIQGMVGADKANEYLPEFRRLTSTFRLIK